MGVMTTRHGRETGRPVIDAGRCSRCGLCVRACPVGVFSATPALVLILGYPAVSFRRQVRRRFLSVT